MNLSYRSFAEVDLLELNECTIHRCTGGPGGDYWHIWFRVLRDSDGEVDTFCVPIIPNGNYTETGPGGKSWGFYHTGRMTWSPTPSINVLNTRELHPGTHPDIPSLWHQTPTVINVPDNERWSTGQ